MAIKPSEGHVEWITDDDTDKYIAPSATKKLQGWIKEEKPPFQYFNWFWRLVDRWLQWAEAQSDENGAAIADNAQAITDEAATRSDADSTLQDNIDAEASARASADSTLQSNINAEASARASADSTLQGNIDTEATARTNGDNTLQSNIDAEATARTNADSAHAALTNAHGATSANTASRIVLRDGNGDIIGRLFRTEYGSTTAGLPYFLGQVALGAGADNYARPMTVAQARTTLGLAPLINGLSSGWIYAADDAGTDYSTDTGHTSVLTLTTPVVTGDVGILVAEFQSFRTGATAVFGIGLRVAATNVDFGDGSGLGWGYDNNNQQSLYGSGTYTHYATLPFVVTVTNTARVFTLYRSVRLLPGGGSAGSQYHRMAIKWLYKQ